MSKSKQPKRHKLLDLHKHPLVVPVVTFLVLFIVSLVAFVSFSATTIGPADSRVVNVYADGKSQTLPTRAKTVGDLLNRLDIKLGEGDVVEPGLDTEILDDNFSVNVYRARPVTVIDGDKKVTVNTATQSPRAVAEEVGTQLFPEDKVEVEIPDSVIDEGSANEELVIERSIPVKLVLYGQSYDLRTHAKTVGDLVEEKGLNTSEVTVLPPADTPLTPNMVVFVTYKDKNIVTAEELIPNAEETVNDPELPMGQTKVKQEGAPGRKVVIYEVDKADPNKKTVLQEVIALQPQNKITAKGSKVVVGVVTGSKADWMRQAGIDPSQYQYVDYIIGRESGWNPGAVSANRCIGLGQKCNAQSLISACPAWQSDPVCQLNHFSGYANGRYGSWQGAYSFWTVNHWW
jgi:uncharacterized protein YabE (DUF348 family)